MDAHLVFEAHDLEVVALASLAIGSDVILGHDEQRYTARSGGRIGRTRQHEVHDVLGQLVFAPGDVDLAAVDPVLARMRPLGDRRRGGAQRTDVAARLRFGEVHRSRPFAGDQLGQVPLLLILAAVVQQCLDRAHGQHRQQRKGEVGRAQVLEHADAQRKWQALAAELLWRHDRVPASLDIVAIGLREAIRKPHFAIDQLRALAVADPVERCPLARCKAADALDDGFDHVGAGGGEAIGLRQFLDPGADLEREDLFGGGGDVGHVNPFSWQSRCAAYSGEP